MSDSSGHPSESKKTSPLVYIILGIVGLAVVVFLFFRSIEKRRHEAEEAKKASTPHRQEVRVSRPHPTPDTAVLLLPGNVQGFRETFIYARVNGYIKNWFVDIGDRVKEGQQLAELETPELDQQLLQAKANLDLAKSSMDRVNSVSIEGAVSVQQVADRVGAYQAALAQVNQLEAQKSFKHVLAPFTGVVTSRNIDIGSLVNAGSSTSQQLFTMAQTNRLRIFVNVPQSFVQNVRVGTSARVLVQELMDRTVIGKVTRTAGALDPDTRTLLVQVEFDNPSGAYLPGMYARVRFVVPRTVRPWIIPANTLVIRTDGPQVVTVTPDSTIAIKHIVINKDNGATLEIASGLKGNELMVTNPSLDLTEGLKVRIANKSQSKKPGEPAKPGESK
jgi:membrane fusion protein (multidrug efflux system)